MDRSKRQSSQFGCPWKYARAKRIAKSVPRRPSNDWGRLLCGRRVHYLSRCPSRPRRLCRPGRDRQVAHFSISSSRAETEGRGQKLGSGNELTCMIVWCWSVSDCPFCWCLSLKSRTFALFLPAFSFCFLISIDERFWSSLYVNSTLYLANFGHHNMSAVHLVLMHLHLKGWFAFQIDMSDCHSNWTLVNTMWVMEEKPRP